MTHYATHKSLQATMGCELYRLCLTLAQKKQQHKNKPTYTASVQGGNSPVSVHHFSLQLWLNYAISLSVLCCWAGSIDYQSSAAGNTLVVIRAYSKCTFMKRKLKTYSESLSKTALRNKMTFTYKNVTLSYFNVLVLFLF